MKEINSLRLFRASQLALLVTSMTFAIRADLISPLGEQFTLNNTQMGWITGTAFWGFALSVIVGGALVDIIGMKRLAVVAFVGHILGIILTITATGFWSLYVSTLFIGLANGMVEAVCNPLIVTLYPDKKAEKLNQFHVWFPGGIVVGGLIAYGFDQIGFGWQLKMASMLIPAVIYAYLFIGQTFPKTERVTSGVSYGEMMKASFSPLFLFLGMCMILTASTELGTNQWISAMLKNVGVPSILILVFINLVMALGRSRAGVFIERMSTIGVLIFSAVFATLGLLWFSYSSGYMTFAAAFVFAVGICFFWPTMLGLVSEKIPDSGAFGISLMGAVGMLATSIVMPYVGKFYDRFTLAALPDGATLESFQSALSGTGEAVQLAQAQLIGGAETLRVMSLMPAVLVLFFVGLYFYDRSKTG